MIKRPGFLVILSCVFVFGILCLRTLALQVSWLHQPLFADDAFYYFVVAQNIVQHGMSTFDGMTLTNGYHPLWMALMAAQFKLFGQSLMLTRCFEFALGAVSLVFAVRLAGLPGFLLNLVFTAGFFAILQRIAFNGMETSLLVASFVVFAYVAERRSQETVRGGVVDGLLGVAVVASRIDAIVFVLPQMLLTAKSSARRISGLSILMLCGLAYGAVNRYYFGVAVPISGQVKALGGLQVNWVLLRFLSNFAHPTTRLFLATGLLLIVAPFLVLKSRPFVNRRLVITFMAGSLIYAVRLGFGSSWVVWSWYGYPVLIGYIACVPGLLGMLQTGFAERRLLPQLAPLAALVLFAIALLGLPKVFVQRGKPEVAQLPDHLDLPQAIAHITDGARVAMGDRAGNFAYHYPGSVNQLEGIMNDDQYLKTLQNKRGVKELLCDRKVRFVVAYEPDLTDYKIHMVRTIRPELSQYPAPSIPVMRNDQVAQVPDLSADRPANETTFLYVWKLRCGTEQTAGSE